jgi:hypothetical protein
MYIYTFENILICAVHNIEKALLLEKESFLINFLSNMYIVYRHIPTSKIWFCILADMRQDLHSSPARFVLPLPPWPFAFLPQSPEHTQLKTLFRACP